MSSTETRPMDDRAREVIRTLALDFEPGDTGETIGLMVYCGLKMLFEASLRHLDPDLATGTTSLRHVIDLVAHCRLDDFEDLQQVIRAAFNVFLEGIPDDD